MKIIIVTICLLTLPLQLLSHEFVIGVNQRDVYRIKGDNGWSGLDIELIKAVFRRTPYQYKIVDMPWPRVLKSLEAGSVDITLAAAVSPERQSYALFSNQVFRYSHYMLFVLRENIGKFDSMKTLADLAKTDATVGALRGAIYSQSYYDLLKNQAFSSRFAFIDNDQQMLKFAHKGRVDAYIDSEIEGKHYLAKHPEYNKDIVPYIRITKDEEAGSRLMFSKKTVNQSTVEIFNQALQDLHDSGEYQQIFKKYNALPVIK